MSDVVPTWLLIFCLLFLFAALPVTTVRCVAILAAQTSLLMTTVLGAAIGAIMFWLIFGSTWATGNSVSSVLPFFGYGGALGAVGGAVFSLTETRLLKRENNND